MATELKSNQSVQPIIADDFSGVTFKVRGMPDLPLNMNKLHPDIIRRAACVGFAQVRIVDAAAVSRNKKDGSLKSDAEMVEEKYERMAALIAHYETGTAEWSRVAEAGPTGGYLFDALCKVYGHMKAPSEIRAWLDKLSEKEQAALREDDSIAPVIADLKRAKMAGKPQPDTKALLAGLTQPLGADPVTDAEEQQQAAEQGLTPPQE
jgi:hypothetical protein